jgi:hypothetical protein
MDPRESARRTGAAAASGVETNLATTPGAAPTSVRQRLEQHRASPTCAACHAVMDPVGFSLENFDLIGEYRNEDGGIPVNATGKLADGTTLDGPASLRKALLDRRGAVASTATEKLLTYAVRPAGGLLRHARRARRRSRRGSSGLPLLVAHHRDREERPVHDEASRGSVMFISKKHLSRRTFLRGAGVTLALPLLDSMVPAATALAQSAAAPKTRMGCIYIPHGATMDKWTPAQVEGKASSSRRSCSRSTRSAIA